MAIPDELKRMLNDVRLVRAQKPEDHPDTLRYAQWRERMATALDALSVVLLYPADRELAAAQAAAARAEAAEIRVRLVR